MTQQTMDWAVQTQQQLQKQSHQKAKQLAETLNTFIPRARQVIDQATRRVLQCEQVPATEKIVSIFEAHTDIIRRGKEAKPVNMVTRSGLMKSKAAWSVTTVFWMATQVTSNNGSQA